MTTESMVEDTLKKGFELYRAQFVALTIGTIIAALGSLLIITAPPLMFGLFYMALKVARGEKTEIGDVFKGFDYLVTSWIMMIISVIAVVIGLICFIIPGLILAVFLQYAVALALIDKRGAVESLKRSYALGKETWQYSTILFLILGVIGSVTSTISGGILSILVLPYEAVTLCVATEMLLAEKKKTTKTTAPATTP